MTTKKKPAKKPAVEFWKWDTTDPLVSTCKIGRYEMVAAGLGNDFSGSVDSMMLLENPLSGQSFETMQLAQLACQDAVLRIERETLELQRLAKK